MSIYEQRLRQVLDAVQDYLPPDGIGVQEAINRIIGAVDPWPTAPMAQPRETHDKWFARHHRYTATADNWNAREASWIIWSAALSAAGVKEDGNGR